MVFIEVVLSFLRMLLTLLTWRFERSARLLLSGVRERVFECGLLVSILPSVLTACSWFNPFPLLADGRGGYPDARNFNQESHHDQVGGFR
jgi:hypothetical protein